MLNLTIGKKLFFGFGLLLIMTTGFGWYSLNTLSWVQEVNALTAASNNRALALLMELSDYQSQMRVFTERTIGQFFFYKQGMASETPEVVQQKWRDAKNKTAEVLKELDGFLTEIEQTEVSEARRQQWGKVRQQKNEILISFEEISREVQIVFDLLNKEDLKALQNRLPILDRLRVKFSEDSKVGGQLIKDAVKIGKKEMVQVNDTARASVLLGIAIMLVFGFSCSLLIYNSIRNPLRKFMQVIEQVGKGDLTKQAEVTSQDEMGKLGQSLNGMISGLREVTTQTQSVTQNLANSANELLASTQQQAASSTEQTSTTQETAATMDEIQASGVQVSTKAKDVSRTSEATSESSKSGLSAVETMATTMEAIRSQAESVAENIVTLSEKTQAVGNIIATVNEIAEQSKLLALNASIESVAGGDQSRRFSVVANEMKNLADQAKDATTQIRTILGDIQQGINSSVMATEEAVKRVDQGKKHSLIVEQTIRHMSKGINESIQAFDQIVAAINQQQNGIDQVSQALKTMTQASEQTAQATRQSENVANDLVALGQQLCKSVERYVI